MLETKEQKQNFFASVAIVLILAVVTACSRTAFYRPEQQSVQQTAESVQQAYQKYLASVTVDKQASEQIFKQLVTEKEVRAQVEADLNVKQKITLPTVDPSAIKLSEASGQQPVVDYLKASVGEAAAFTKKTSVATGLAFGQNPSVDAQLRGEVAQLTKKLSEVAVPKEAEALHRSLLATYQSYSSMLETSEKYGNGEATEPWPDLYQHYGAVDQTVTAYETELKKLDTKYQISALGPLTIHVAGSPAPVGPAFPGIQTANALFGIGDFSFTTVTLDIPKLIFDAIKVALVNSFTAFMSSSMQKVITKIESNYAIANFLYYADALVAGQYSEDYLRKYVKDEVDRRVIKQFIPQMSCNQNNGNLRPLLQAKAQNHLGFNPDDLSPNDPEYYTKLSRVGSYLSSPEGWLNSYQALADQAKGEAEKAAENELRSTGLKNPRDVTQLLIGKSQASIDATLKASLNNLLNVGTQATSGSGFKGLVTNIVTTLLETFLNKFVFRGVAGNPLSVLKEQAVCVAALQTSLVIPSDVTSFIAPSVDEEAVIREACAQNPRGCDPASSTNPSGP